MAINLGSIIWQQFGAAITMLENVLHAWPDELWRDIIWHDPDGPEYGEFWFVVYHTLAWLDRYLSGSQPFTLPAPFVAGKLPEKPYTREQLQTYLDHCRQKCRATLEPMNEATAGQRYEFPWGGELSFAELQLYNMRHVQEHAAQLGLHLGQKGIAAPDWESRADWAN